MKFELAPEQQQFSAMLHDLLTGADTAGAARAWADGEHERGRKLLRALAEVGVTGLLIDDEHGGVGAEPVDVVVAFEALGYHAVPGPLVESAVVAPTVYQASHANGADRLAAVAGGGKLATATFESTVPLALDADAAQLVLELTPAGASELTEPTVQYVRSIDPARRLFRVSGERTAIDVAPETGELAFDLGALAVAAQLLGAGQWLLDEATAYALQRSQYGRLIGEYQAIKHLLADVVTNLELARPLLYGAAVAAGQPSFSRDVSAAKVKAGDAAYLAARTALQVHGAIGYTAEHDLGLRLTKVRALMGAWGDGTFHRDRVLTALAGAQ